MGRKTARTTMADESMNQPRVSEAKHQPDPMSPEQHQPDPMLQMSAGQLGPGALTLVAVVIAVILGVVFYGLNNGATAEHPAAAPTPAPSSQPAAGGKANPPAKSAPQTNTTGGGKG
jgi:hypothetical protein